MANRTKKRLLWTLRQYGDRDPLTAIYTYAIIATSPLFGPGTSLLTRRPSLSEIFDKAAVSSPGPPMGPGPDATVGQMLRWSVAWATVNGENAEWRDSSCAKLIPAIGRWTARALRDFARVFTDKVWNSPYRELSKPTWAIVAPAWGIPQGHARVYVGNVAQQLGYLCDWYRAARPDLGRFATWDQALAAATCWHEQIARKSVENVEQGPVVYRWPDGWTVQALTERSMFREEGASLGHCLAESPDYWEDYRSGNAVYFSMRTPNGDPWLTFEVEAPRQGLRGPFSARVAQIKGCKNRIPGTRARSRDCPPPDPGECARVWEFLAKTPWLVGPDYAACWGFSAAARGLPSVIQTRDPGPYRAEDLLRPPSAGFEPGAPTKRFKARWWK